MTIRDTEQRIARNDDVQALAVHGAQLLAGTRLYGIWRRDVVEMMPTGAVAAGEDVRTRGVIVPNPARGSTSLQLPDIMLAATIDLVDMNGALVARYHPSGAETTRGVWRMDLRRLASGRYLCVVRGADGRVIESLPVDVIGR